MSICDLGIGIKLLSRNVTIEVSENHPLLVLANQLPWKEMFNWVERDLVDTTALKTFYLGRKLKARIHLGAYLLQKFHNYTGRGFLVAETCDRAADGAR